MRPYETGPPPCHRRPGNDEQNEGEVHDHDAVGEDPVEHAASACERTRHTAGGPITLLGAAAQVSTQRKDHPTPSSLANRLLDSQAARVLAFVAWADAMVGLFRR